MAAPAGEVKNTPNLAPTNPVDSLKQQVNALSLQINLLKSQIEGGGKSGRATSQRKTPTFEQLNQMSKKPAAAPHADRRIEYRKFAQTASAQGLINRLELIEIELSPEQLRYLALPPEAPIYINNTETGWRYFRGTDLVFVPDFHKTQAYAPAEQIYAGMDEQGQIKWQYYYPPFSQNVLDYLSKQAFGAEIITTALPQKEKRQISFHQTKYYVESFGHKVPIGMSILSQGWIVLGVSPASLGANLQLLHFQNFMAHQYFDSGKVKESKSVKCRYLSQKGIYLVNAYGKVTYEVLPLSSSPFFEGTQKTPNLEQYVKYLNTIFFES